MDSLYIRQLFGGMLSVGLHHFDILIEFTMLLRLVFSTLDHTQIAVCLKQMSGLITWASM